MVARRWGGSVSRHRKRHDPGFPQLEFTFTFPVAPVPHDVGIGQPPRRVRERMQRDDGSGARLTKAQAREHARRPTPPRERIER
jgi:hypothetical protein